MRRRLLVGCEYSGVVRDAFIRAGWDAWSCDLLPTESPGPHYQCDIREVLGMGWDLGIFHPPCTYLANSGVRHLHSHVTTRNGVRTKIHGEERWKLMLEACDFFNELLSAPIDRICVENPVQHGYAREKIRKYDQVIQPYHYGHEETKTTCLWLKNLPKLEPTKIMEIRNRNLTPSGRGKMGPRPDRGKLRSKTYFGVGEAMANQWGNL